MIPRALSKVAPLAIAAVFAVAACADSEDGTTAPTVEESSTTVASDGATSTSGSSASTAGDGATTTQPTVEDLRAALAAGDLSTIAQAIDLVGVENLIGSESFTLLAPNDDAFRSLTPAQLSELLANPTELTDVLKNHLVAEKLSADDLRAMSSVETAAGTSLPIEVDGDTLTIGGAKVLEADRDAGPGVIHLIDTVLLIES